MTVPAVAESPRLSALVERFVALGDTIDRRTAAALLAGQEIEWDDVAPFVQESEHGYTRRRIARTDAFEMLVMTWRPGQGSAPHDHAGSLCALKIIRGGVQERRFATAIDGYVDPLPATEVREGEVVVDVSEHIHALENSPSAPETLVTLHVYAPPLPELRRFAARPAGAAVKGPFARRKHERARTVAIVGGGFSGTLTQANLLREATSAAVPLHVVLLDRQAAFGEGAAYRTADSRHLLNVPASNMSAWPDRPSDFFEWALDRDPTTKPSEFLPRKLYGEYVRDALGAVADAAPEYVSAEILRVEVDDVTRTREGFRVTTGEGRTLEADAVVLATGHRAPDDPIGSRWSGSRARYIQDPWASLALSAIAPDEPIVLLGSSLTAIDVLLTVTRAPRTAKVTALSRRGLMPESHSRLPQKGIDPSAWLEPLLAQPGGATARGLLHEVRTACRAVEAQGGDWRTVIDGLRPHTARIWQSLSKEEASRFLRHPRAFWEVRRHRMAPRIADDVAALTSAGVFESVAGRVLRAEADEQGVTLEVRRRGERESEIRRAAWIVNCTGPGAGAERAKVIGALHRAGQVEVDPQGLGLVTGEAGRVVVRGEERPDLLVVGTLRKPALWESTAVPELRQQAKAAAEAVLAHLRARG